MFNLLKVAKGALVGAMLTVLPMSASALTVLADGGSYTIDAAGAAPFVGTVDAVGGAGSFTSTFSATPPNFGLLEATISATFVGLFTDLKVEWLSNPGGVVLAAVDPITGDLILKTAFTAANAVQDLVFSWTGSTDTTGVAGGPVGFDFNVAPVPLPAGGLLLITALGGLAFARRNRSAA